MSDSEDEDVPELVALPPCPVTILSGFLGAGKTTLVQNILKSPHHGRRIAVIENEYGEGLEIESMIAKDGVDNSSLTELMELPNGCICCTIKDSLVATLEVLLERRAAIDYILIECSGLANPGPIAGVFWLDEGLQSRLQLDGIVTVVDAKQIRHQLATTIEAAQQIAYADRILLNKVDLVDDTAEIEQLIRDIHPLVEMRPTKYALVEDLAWILDARCLQVDQFPLIDPISSSHDHSHDHGESCNQCSNHQHTQSVSTIALTHPGSVSVRALDRWLAEVLWPNQDEQDKVLRARLEQPLTEHQSALPSTEQEIFRIKGVLSVAAVEADEEYDVAHLVDGLDRRRFIVQGVADLWEVHPSTLEWENEPRCGKLVLIGRHLHKDKLQEGFEACFVNGC